VGEAGIVIGVPIGFGESLGLAAGLAGTSLRLTGAAPVSADPPSNEAAAAFAAVCELRSRFGENLDSGRTETWGGFSDTTTRSGLGARGSLYGEMAAGSLAAFSSSVFP
jgi:hypothetical protein